VQHNYSHTPPVRSQIVARSSNDTTRTESNPPAVGMRSRRLPAHSAQWSRPLCSGDRYATPAAAVQCTCIVSIVLVSIVLVSIVLVSIVLVSIV
jgi:hypothetical protein